jgi:hypothetical protein
MELTKQESEDLTDFNETFYDVQDVAGTIEIFQMK